MELATLRIGFVPLIDAAPLLVAEKLGFFRQQSLDVSLHRQVGWANIRDKLSFGQLDAGHALLGMPLTSHLGRDGFSEPLTTIMHLGVGGNAITVRKELHDMGVRSATDLATLLKTHPEFQGGRVVIGHVFSSSMHHYLLREWLASAGIDPDHDVKLCVIPPPQMADHMRGQYVDLFCVGEPWNTLATREEFGVAIVATTDILPNHAEKVLAVTKQLAAAHADLLPSLIEAVIRACLWCDDPANHHELARLLAQPDALAQPVDVLEESLRIDRTFGTSRQQKNSRPPEWHLRSFAAPATFPNKMHAVWLMRQMTRWGHLHPEADIAGIADQCCDTRPYRIGAAALGIACPERDFAPIPLRHGRTFSFDDLASPLHAATAASASGALVPASATRSRKGVSLP